MSASLANRATIRTIVQTYMEAEETVRRSFAAILDAERKLDEVFLEETRGFTHAITISPTADRCHHQPDWKNIEATVDQMRRNTWHKLVQRLQLQRMLSVSQWDALSKWLDAKKMPEITPQSVEAFVAKYERNLPAMIESAIQEVHAWLRPRSRQKDTAGQYKTNSLFDVGERVIVKGLVKVVIGSWQVEWSEAQHLTALENVFLAFDGKGMFTKAHGSALADAIVTSHGQGETEYFAFKCCGNGNLHLRFKRTDLLAKLNAVAGGKVLKQAEVA